MDTKWKNRKKAISFMVFFLGVSLTLGSVVNVLKLKPNKVKIWQLDKLLERDYQQSERFQGYIANRLENFLIMAVGGSGLGGVWQSADGTYYSSYYSGYDGYNDVFYYYDGDWAYKDEQDRYIDSLLGSLEGLDEMWFGYAEILEETERNVQDSSGVLEAYRKEIEAYRKEIEAYRKELRDYRKSLEEGYGEGALAESSGAEGEVREGAANQAEMPLSRVRNQKMIQKFHDWIKGDKNLLYSISYDGKVLYSNAELPVEGGNMTAPEGYNFLLYFDGEKVRIVKDGKEIDVYGDGYYRDGQGSGWYVPGYRNFQTSEEMKKVEICMAVAGQPVLYMDGSYVDGGSRQYDNTLYWMNYNRQANREALLGELGNLAVGLFFLLLSWVCRKSCREAKQDIARFQSNIWVECKILLFGILCAVVFDSIKYNAYGLWYEVTNAVYVGDYWEGEVLLEGGTVSRLGLELLEAVPTLLFVFVFWGVGLLWNDLKYNRKIWKHGLVAKLYRTFSAKSIHHPLSGKIAWRNTAVFLCAVVFGLLMTALAMSGARSHGSMWETGVLASLGVICFLVVAYLAGAKNMETAKDLETLSRCVCEIRDGNYEDIGERFSGHDLEDIMGQLEDIRCGMAKAVDEQMKSERMKVELIANVSHDIKTPLTSIISYVQFLKQEEGLPDHVKDYVAILDEKSQRLKNMVQDVFAVSKAASGELPMHMEELDFGKLLCQTMADMEEEIGKSPVVFRTEIPKEPVMIMADGQRMYRVFQNLFQNAIKYSLEGSRVYVALKAEGGMAVASVKNASRQELEKGMDFAERFSRGDRSRTDGGSGLGLSIAQSFTEACGGEFSWGTDADLFVVKVSFRTI